MSELRQDILTGNWSVIAAERGKAPQKLKDDLSTGEELPEYADDCPFCPGNEERFPPVVVESLDADDGEWLARIIENKYKIFDDFANCPVEPEPFEQDGIYSRYQGCGNHYLTVESRLHNRQIGRMEVPEIRNILHLWRHAARILEGNPNNLITILFKNNGPRSGASQPHSHSQMVGSRVVPAWIRNALHCQERYFDRTGACALCTMIDYELKVGERVVCEYEDAVVLSPYAAGSPYETWVVPKRHFACYRDVTDDELTGLARGLRSVLSAYMDRLGGPDYNCFVHSSPYPLSQVPFYHSYIQVIPRVKIDGGFEVGTRLPVNTVAPEQVAELLTCRV